MDTVFVTHAGGCHCGRVRFEVDLSLDPVALDCTCSICRMTGYLHLIVPTARFRLLAGDGMLVDYRFGTGTARHLFCGHCGIKSVYMPRSHPDGYSVNARCVDGLALDALRIATFDDGDRDAAMASLHSLDL